MAFKRTKQQKRVKSQSLQNQQLSQLETSSKYRSKFEAGLAAGLIQNKVNFTYEDMTLPYVIKATYKPDFILSNGVVIEAKGHFRPEDRKKLLAVKKQHPDLDIRFVFQNGNDKLTRAKRSVTYGQWATRHGFKWASGSIPQDWYDQ